jgi:hypothetical protein
VGGPYSPPAANTLVLGLPLSASNVRVSLAGGGIESSALGSSGGGSIEQVLTLGSNHVGSLPAGGSNPAFVTLNVAPSTGLVTGNFKLVEDDPTDVTPPIAKVTRTAPYYGMVVPRLEKVVGYFILAGLPGSPTGSTAATSHQLSGQVIVEGNAVD